MMAQSGTTQLESIENLLEDIRADVQTHKRQR